MRGISKRFARPGYFGGLERAKITPFLRSQVKIISWLVCVESERAQNAVARARNRASERLWEMGFGGCMEGQSSSREGAESPTPLPAGVLEGRVARVVGGPNMTCGAFSSRGQTTKKSNTPASLSRVKGDLR